MQLLVLNFKFIEKTKKNRTIYQMMQRLCFKKLYEQNPGIG
jgi:hypothetical protein